MANSNRTLPHFVQSGTRKITQTYKNILWIHNCCFDSFLTYHVIINKYIGFNIMTKTEKKFYIANIDNQSFICIYFNILYAPL